MAQTATALILADVDEPERSALVTACSEGGFTAVVEPGAEAALQVLSTRRFDALVVHLGTPGAALVCMKARGKLLRLRIPVLALVDSLDDAAFARAYRAGADEVLLADRPAQLAARLKALPHQAAIPQAGVARGDAIVADADRNRADVLDRVLRDAGFRVDVVSDGFSARLQAGRPSLKVAVIDASLEDVPALIRTARAKGSRCAWVVRVRPEQLDELGAQLASFERVAVVSAYGPPDDVLFETNRLLEPKPSDGRADRRMLHGAVLKLDWANGQEPDVGYSYNVSAVGLFVRTLVPPSGQTVRIEVTPPGGDEVARLVAAVVWRREFGPTRKEAVPAGFGVRIIGGDVAAWSSACPRVPSLRPRMPTSEGTEATSTRAQPTLDAVAPPKVVAAAAARPQQSSVDSLLASALGSGPIGGKGASPIAMNAGVVQTAPPGPDPLPPPRPAAHPAASEAAVSLQPSDVTPASLGFEDLSDMAVSAPPSLGDARTEPPGAPAEPRRGPPSLPVPDMLDEPLAEEVASLRTSTAPPAGPGASPPAQGESSDDPGDAGPPRAPGGPPPLAPPAGPGRAGPPPLAPSEEPRAPVAPALPEIGAVAAASAPAHASRPEAHAVADPFESAAERAAPPSAPASLRPRRKLWPFAVAAIVIGAGLAFVVPSRTKRGEPAATPVAPAAAPSPVAPPAPPPPTVVAPTPESAPAAVSSGAPSEVPVAAASAESPAAPSAAPIAEAPPAASVAPPVASVAPPAPAVAPPEEKPAAAPAAAAEPDAAALAALPKGMGIVYVASSLSTNVYLYGNLAGTTNQPITMKCGPRFLRLGSAPGVWQSEGQAYAVKCGGFTRVELSP